MNPAVILALLSDLYAQVTELAKENAMLRQALAAQQPDDPANPED